MRKSIASLFAVAAMFVGTSLAQAQPYGDYPYEEPYYNGGPYGSPYGGDAYAYGGNRYYQGGNNYRYGGCRDDRTAGTLIGGLLGGIIGNNLSRGRGRAPATIAGVIFGGIAGNAIARSSCRNRYADAHYYGPAYYDAFERPDYGRRYNWRNPYSNNYGYVTPIRDYDDGDRYGYGGNDCRQFEQNIWINGRRQTAYGTACRNRDGTWRIVNY